MIGLTGFACAFVAGVAGCASDPSQGYSFSTTFDTNIQTVYVPMFKNNTYTHGVEIDLTDAVIKEIKATTPWRVVAESDAQATLTGTIVDSRLQPLSYARVSGLVQEQAVILTVQFDFKDIRTGKILASRRQFNGVDSFVPAQGLNERIETGEHATVQDLARAIVAELRSGW